MADEGGFAQVGGLEGLHGGKEDSDVTGRGAQVEAGQRGGDGGENLGIGGGGSTAVEEFEAHLQEFVGASVVGFLTAKEPRRRSIAGGIGTGGHVHLHDTGTVKSGRSIISPRSGVAGDIGAGADIFAIEVKQDVGGWRMPASMGCAPAAMKWAVRRWDSARAAALAALSITTGLQAWL